MRLSALIFDLKADKLQDSRKEEEYMMFHGLQVLGMNDDLWDRVRDLGSGIWNECVSWSSFG